MADPEKKEEEELVPVGDGVEKESEEKEELEEEELAELEEEEEEEEKEEERLGTGEEEEDGEKQARRKEERKTRRQRQKDAQARDKQELVFQRSYIEKLSTKVNELEGRMGHGETAQVDSRITDVKSKIKLADQVISKAVTQNDGEAMVEAQSIRDNLRDSLSQLEEAKTSMTRREEPEGNRVDARLINHAQSWMQHHSWWDPNGGDADSREVSRLDAQMVAEGYDPNNSDYWDELSKRVKDAIPERYEEGNGARTPRKKGKRKASGPTMSAGGRERPLKKNEVYVSPERKEAMVEAGVWEDPELRQKYLKSYATYDANNRA